MGHCFRIIFHSKIFSPFFDFIFDWQFIFSREAIRRDKHGDVPYSSENFELLIIEAKSGDDDRTLYSLPVLMVLFVDRPLYQIWLDCSFSTQDSLSD